MWPDCLLYYTVPFAFCYFYTRDTHGVKIFIQFIFVEYVPNVRHKSSLSSVWFHRLISPKSSVSTLLGRWCFLLLGADIGESYYRGYYMGIGLGDLHIEISTWSSCHSGPSLLLWSCTFRGRRTIVLLFVSIQNVDCHPSYIFTLLDITSNVTYNQLFPGALLYPKQYPP